LKVAGFTFIRNAVKYDYPIVEAIQSILPLCDEVVVNIGNSEDQTEALIASMGSSKIRVVHSIWDDTLRSGGRVLAEETNKAFDQVSADADWCIYIQADEVIHEKYYPAIGEAMRSYSADPHVEGLLFNYLHFYASYDYTADSRNWYDREIRVIRNDKAIRSYRDAQGFRKNGKKLHVRAVDAYVYHYGWVKPPEIQIQKISDFHQLWTAEDKDYGSNFQTEDLVFDYSQIDSLRPFSGTHPAVMQDRVNRKNWRVKIDVRAKNFSIKGRILYWLEQRTGKRLFGYRNYKLL
jgi:hypothetical protein